MADYDDDVPPLLVMFNSSAEEQEQESNPFQEPSSYSGVCAFPSYDQQIPDEFLAQFPEQFNLEIERSVEDFRWIAGEFHGIARFVMVPNQGICVDFTLALSDYHAFLQKLKTTCRFQRFENTISYDVNKTRITVTFI